MRIDNEQQRIQMMELLNTANVQQNTDNTTQTGELQQDEYISTQQVEGAIPCENYNDIFKNMDSSKSNTEPMMPPPPKPPAETEETDETAETDETELTEEQQTVSSAIDSILQNISETMRASTDTVLSKMQELGMTPEDLLDSDNLATLANALNEGAEELGLPTVDDLDSAISGLLSNAESEVESIMDELSLSDEDFEQLLEEIKAYFAQQAEEQTTEETTDETTEAVAEEQTVTL